MKSESVGTETRCPACGAAHEPAARFCPECGRALRLPGTRATFGPRYAAFLVDLTVVLAVWIVSSFLAQPLSSLFARETGLRVAGFQAPETVGTVIQVLLLPIVALLYFAISEGRNGRTVGKRVVGLRVRKLGGSLPGFGRALLRAAVVWGPLVMLIGGQMASGLERSAASVALVRAGAVLFPLVWVGNVLLAILWRERRGIHDLAAGTEDVRE